MTNENRVSGDNLRRPCSYLQFYSTNTRCDFSFYNCIIGELDMPENVDKIKVNTRKGVEVEYLRTTKTA